MTTPEALLPVREVAALWRCSDQHIYNLIAQGKLRTVTLGARKTRIPESALAEYVERFGEQAPVRGLTAGRPPIGPSQPPRPPAPGRPAPTPRPTTPSPSKPSKATHLRGVA